MAKRVKVLNKRQTAHAQAKNDAIMRVTLQMKFRENRLRFTRLGIGAPRRIVW